MIPVYYLLIFLLLLVAGPFLLLQKKARAGLSQKFGVIPDSIRVARESIKHGIWIHSVSVGEFNAVRPLIEKLHETLPALPIAVSTTTLTGQTLAQERVGRFARVFYFPFDLPFATRAWLRALNPALVVIAETELWPGFLSECRKLGIKAISVNGRMSPRSFRSYNRYKFFFGRALRNYSKLGAQSENEAVRYRTVGGAELPVVVTGNMKLDGLTSEGDTAVQDLKDKLNIAPNDFVIVAGSTHEGEERALIDAHKALVARYEQQPSELPHPRLIIAPRHPERFERVVDLVIASGFKPRRFSRKERFEDKGERDIFILDGLGQLAKYYSLATIAFVGGTIKPVGGHNLLEPYAYSVPAICGPHVHKTRDIANALLELDAIVMVKTPEELSQRLAQFQANREPAKALGRKGREWINENQGAVDRTLEMMLAVLGTTGSAETKLSESASKQSFQNKTSSETIHPRSELTAKHG